MNFSAGDGLNFSNKQLSIPWQTDPFNSIFEEARFALHAAQCTVRGGTWVFEKLGMGTSGRIVAEVLGIPVIGYGPGNEETLHDEYVEIAKINEVFFGTSVIAHRIIGETSAGIY